MKRSEFNVGPIEEAIGVGHDHVLRAGVDHQSLNRIEIRKLFGNYRITRIEAVDLLVHRDGFKGEFLLAIALGDARETGNRFFLIAGLLPAVIAFAQNSSEAEKLPEYVFSATRTPAALKAATTRG